MIVLHQCQNWQTYKDMPLLGHKLIAVEDLYFNMKSEIISPQPDQLFIDYYEMFEV